MGQLERYAASVVIEVPDRVLLHLLIDAGVDVEGVALVLADAEPQPLARLLV